MKALHSAFLSATILTMASCMRPDKERVNHAHLAGTWQQPVPGIPHMHQGFTLLPDGSARSENMATLRYTSWSISADTLLLTGESLGNGLSFTFTDTLTFTLTHPDTLLINNGGFIEGYTRKN